MINITDLELFMGIAKGDNRDRNGRKTQERWKMQYKILRSYQSFLHCNASKALRNEGLKVGCPLNGKQQKLDIYFNWSLAHNLGQFSSCNFTELHTYSLTDLPRWRKQMSKLLFKIHQCSFDPSIATINFIKPSNLTKQSSIF